MKNAERYTIQVRRVVIEGEEYFRASVAEFPDLNEYAETAIQAYELALESVSILLAEVKKTGQRVPEPNEDLEYSGRVTLRLAKHVHRRAACLAELDGVSLNNWLSTAIVEATTGKLVAMTIQTQQPMTAPRNSALAPNNFAFEETSYSLSSH